MIQAARADKAQLKILSDAATTFLPPMNTLF